MWVETMLIAVKGGEQGSAGPWEGLDGSPILLLEPVGGRFSHSRALLQRLLSRGLCHLASGILHVHAHHACVRETVRTTRHRAGGPGSCLAVALSPWDEFAGAATEQARGAGRIGKAPDEKSHYSLMVFTRDSESLSKILPL